MRLETTNRLLQRLIYENHDGIVGIEPSTLACNARTVTIRTTGLPLIFEIRVSSSALEIANPFFKCDNVNGTSELLCRWLDGLSGVVYPFISIISLYLLFLIPFLFQIL